MDLRELAVEYRECGDNCKKKLSELEAILESKPMSNTEKLRLRRAICILSGMTRDALATSRYLYDYYDRQDAYEGRQSAAFGSGISGSAAVYQAGHFL